MRNGTESKLSWRLIRLSVEDHQRAIQYLLPLWPLVIAILLVVAAIATRPRPKEFDWDGARQTIERLRNEHGNINN